jgi:hypothetical protein
MAFFKRVFGALGSDDKKFFQRILSNKRQRVLRADRKDTSVLVTENGNIGIGADALRMVFKRGFEDWQVLDKPSGEDALPV